MRTFKKWASRRDETRDGLLRHFSEAQTCLEQARGGVSTEAARGEIQSLVAELQGLRARLEVLPADRLASLSTLRELGSLDDAVEAVIEGKSEADRAGGLRAGRAALAAISRQFA